MSNTLAFYVDDDLVFRDGRDTLINDMDVYTSLDVFLARVAARFSDKVDGGTVLITAPTLKRLGFPAKVPKGKNAQTHPVLDCARNVGWEITAVSPWMTFHRERFAGPSVHIGVLPWLSQRTFHYLNQISYPAGQTYDAGFEYDGMAMTADLRMFSSLIGAAYRMTPGVTACAALMKTWKGETPYWKPKWSNIQPADYEREKRYQWANPKPIQAEYEHGWDIRQQYLAAASVAEVATNPLIHTGRTKFDKKPGYWLITVPDWNFTQCPHPAGNYEPGERVWVATPTVAYLHELESRHGLIAAPQIHDSWTTYGSSHRMFRSWAERIRDGIAFADASGLLGIRDGLKLGYKQSFGLWQTPTGLIHRPDWSDTVAAHARINLHRKLLAEGNRHGGSWPSRIHYDCVFYASDEYGDEIQHPRAPETFYDPKTHQLPYNIGKFKYEKSVPFGEPLRMDAE